MIALLALVAGIVLGLVLAADDPGGACSPTCRSPSSLLSTPSSVPAARCWTGIFNDRVFVISFIGNVLVAALVVFLGDQLGVGAQLSTGVVVVFSIRIFANAAAIRRHLFHA